MLMMKSTIYVPPTTPMLKSRVRFYAASVRQVPVDDSRRSPMLNLCYQELGQCATWITGSTDTASMAFIRAFCRTVMVGSDDDPIPRACRRARLRISSESESGSDKPGDSPAVGHRNHAA
jgi:hypothetical protein